MKTQQEVDSALDAAYDNGYTDIIHYTPNEVAVDLCDHAEPFEGEEVTDLVSLINNWQIRKLAQLK